MRTRLFIIAALTTLLYGALGSLWLFPAGEEGPPAEAHRDPARPAAEGVPARGLPLVALQRYPDLSLTLDGRPVSLEGEEVRRRNRFSQGLRYKPRPLVDPIVLYGVSFSSVDLTRVQPEDGPRPGNWTREEHWLRASWTHPGDGSPQARVWNVAEILRAFERELGPGQEPEAVFLEMGSPIRPVEPLWFVAAALWLLCAWVALVTGLCSGFSPRRLFGRTLAALALGPLWFGLAALSIPRFRRGAVAAALVLVAGAAPAQQRPEAVTEYGAYETLRLKAADGIALKARLEVFGGGEWRGVRARGTDERGWKPFAAPPNQRQLIQYLCDLPLGEARRAAATSGAGAYVRVTVRRSGAHAWLSGSWQGQFRPPPIGVKAWTYWLPSVPPPIQSTAGLVTLLFLLLWIGCIAAVRAEAGNMELVGAATLWRHAGWLHLPGAVLFFATHPALPLAGIGRELAPPRRLERRRDPNRSPDVVEGSDPPARRS